MLGFIIKKITKSVLHAIDGLKRIWQKDSSFVIEVCLLPFGVLFAYLTTDHMLSFALLVSCMLLVLIVEVINTAIEITLDTITTNIHPMIKAAKDIAAFSVLLTIINLIIIWLIILIY